MLQFSLLSAYTGTLPNADGDVESYLYPDVWTSFAKSGLSSVFLWCFVALLGVLLIVGAFVMWKKRETMKRYLAVAVSLAVGFALAVIITMFSLEIMEMREEGVIYDLVLYPAVVLGAIVILSAAGAYISYLFGEKAFRIGKIVALFVTGAALIAMLICLGVYGAGQDSDITSLDNALLYVSAVVLIGLLVFFALFLGRKEPNGFDSKSISYAAVCIAMSFALSYIRIFKLPQGGSVTIASLLPLMIYAYMFGVKKGVFAGMIYGILQAVQDPWLIHPAQFLLDYPIAFACIGLAGLFANVRKLDKLPQIQFALGAIVASAMRFVSHVLSGVFAFADLTGDPAGAWVYSLGYNSFVFVDIAIVIAVGVVIFCSPAVVKAVRRFRPTEKKQVDETQNEGTMSEEK